MSSWKNVFAFTKQERNGIIVLIVLILAVVVYLIIPSNPAPKNYALPIVDVPSSVKDTTEIQETIAEKNSSEENEELSDTKERSVFQQTELFPFNPNGLPEEDWVRLGLSPAQAKSIKKFESKGGTFRKKEDVKKLFVISPEKYLQLEPYIVIPEFSGDTTKTFRKKESNVVYELNSADTSILVRVKGIGPVFAARIVAYRNKLGGFHHKEQLKEVYGVDDEKYSLIQASFTVDSSYISKININTVEIAELRKHPYFTSGLATALVNYRKMHGPYQQLKDIMNCRLVNAELYRKIAPYLTI